MEIQLKLYGSSKILSDKDTLNIQLPDNSNIEKLRNILNKIISKKHLKSNLENLPKTAAFFSEKDEVVNDNYKLKNKESISIIPPIGGG
jgi:molybdopterin converting factor small subunit|tara:strand:+ start:98 stop:364 length:267 start_codon:yes stop_codon:yes gene_type:complete